MTWYIVKGWRRTYDGRRVNMRARTQNVGQTILLWQQLYNEPHVQGCGTGPTGALDTSVQGITIEEE